MLELTYNHDCNINTISIALPNLYTYWPNTTITNYKTLYFLLGHSVRVPNMESGLVPQEAPELCDTHVTIGHQQKMAPQQPKQPWLYRLDMMISIMW